MSTSVFEEGRRCLVLNKSWTPIGTIPLQEAIVKVFSCYSDGEPKARIIDHQSYQTFTWEDWSKLKPIATDEVIRGARIAFRVPEVILLTRYDRLPTRTVHFSRRNLYKRDGMTCQYCGCKPGSEELTVDHVIPRSQGGGTTWDNCVLACVECNRKKANRTPEQARMKLAKKPKKPNGGFFRYQSLKPVKSWSAFIGEAYWTVGIGDD
jgi:5-methylcytosine-specific restriction endonuclease McrA